MELPAISAGPDGFVLALRVIPKAKREAVVGVHGGALKLRVQAAPERGKANQAIIKLLEKSLGEGISVHLVRGETSQDKVVEVIGFRDLGALEAALGRVLADAAE